MTCPTQDLLCEKDASFLNKMVRPLVLDEDSELVDLSFELAAERLPSAHVLADFLDAFAEKERDIQHKVQWRTMRDAVIGISLRLGAHVGLFNRDHILLVSDVGVSTYAAATASMLHQHFWDGEHAWELPHVNHPAERHLALRKDLLGDFVLYYLAEQKEVCQALGCQKELSASLEHAIQQSYKALPKNLPWTTSVA